MEPILALRVDLAGYAACGAELVGGVYAEQP
jgi:hypothetical protein